MNRGKWAVLAATTAAAMAAPLAALGQMAYSPTDWWDNRWYLTPFGGYVLSDSDRRADDGWQGGLAIGKPVSPAFNVELRGFYEQLGSESGGPGKYKNYGATFDGQWFFLRRRGVDYWNRFQPYVVAGVGGMVDDVPGAEDLSLVFNAGVGFVWRITDWGRLVGDTRYRYDNNKGNIATGSNFDDWIFSLGLQIPLGAVPKVAEAPRPAPMAPAPAPAPKPAAPPPAPKPEPVSRSFEISADGMFAFDSAELTAVGRSRIDEIVRAVRGTGFTATSIAIAGYTDPLGAEAYNQRLSERRAEVVRNYLVSQGVSSGIITAEGLGESNLKVTEAECRAKGQAKTMAALIACLAPNRRVEALVRGTQVPMQ